MTVFTDMAAAPTNGPILVFGEIIGGEDHKSAGPKVWAVVEWEKLDYPGYGGEESHGWVCVNHGQYYYNVIMYPTKWAYLPGDEA